MTALQARAFGPGDLLTRRLSAFAPLGDGDRALLAALPPQRRQHAPGDDLDELGEALRQPRLVVSGWGCRMRTLPDGRRQIFSFLLPGDLVGIGARPNPLAVCRTTALTRMETADARPLLDVLSGINRQAPGVRAALLVCAAQEEACLLDQVVRLGRQTALERTAHLLLELRWRLSTAGLSGERRFPLPLTQEMLADALGLSVVHANRTLQALRRDRLLELRAGYAQLPDLD